MAPVPTLPIPPLPRTSDLDRCVAVGPLPGHGQGREGPGEGPAREPLPWKPCPGCRGTSVGLAEPDPHLSPRRLRPRQPRGPPASAAAPACAGCDLRCTFPLSVASARHCSRPPPGSLGPLGASGLPRPPAPARSCWASRPGSSPPPSAFVECLLCVGKFLGAGKRHRRDTWLHRGLRTWCRAQRGAERAWRRAQRGAERAVGWWWGDFSPCTSSQLPQGRVHPYPPPCPWALRQGAPSCSCALRPLDKPRLASQGPSSPTPPGCVSWTPCPAWWGAGTGEGSRPRPGCSSLSWPCRPLSPRWHRQRGLRAPTPRSPCSGSRTGDRRGASPMPGPSSGPPTSPLTP